MKVALLGATAKSDRYAYKALEKLIEKEHKVYPIHPKMEFLLGKKVYSSISEIDVDIDTLTLYVGKARSDIMIDEIIALNPRRIIFNPGAENDLLRDKAKAAGIEALYACTLVMLTTGQF
ncbi:MAG: CoA-binding protein [Candidatus Margulisbacteria bacterium]|nr:CoA-binding protein [Candidatus Margulisiibacteriota bacterium]